MLVSIPSLMVSSSVTGSFLRNLYAYYKLDESAGTSATDASGNGLTLVQFGGSGSMGANVGGIINGCRTNDGSTNVRFHDSTVSHFQFGSSHFSFSTWVYLNTAAQTGNDTGILSKAGDGTYEWILWWPSNGPYNLGASTDGTAGAGFKHVFWGSNASASAWHHICGGWDGTNIWLVQDGGTRVTTAFAGPIFTSSLGFEFGFEGGSGGNFNGRLDETGIWRDRDLTDYEVGLLYNGGAGLAFSSF